MLNIFHVRKIYDDIPLPVKELSDIHVSSGLNVVDFKTKVLGYYDEGHSQLAVGKAFGISQSTVAKYERERKVLNR